MLWPPKPDPVGLYKQIYQNKLLFYATITVYRSLINVSVIIVTVTLPVTLNVTLVTVIVTLVIVTLVTATQVTATANVTITCKFKSSYGNSSNSNKQYL